METCPILIAEKKYFVFYVFKWLENDVASLRTSLCSNNHDRYS